MPAQRLVIGIDYGSDSVRALVADAADGRTVGTHVHHYERWKRGLFCDPANNQFRQHPLDYIEGLEKSVVGALAQAGPGAGGQVVGLAVDTTGSTPCAVDVDGTPLALLPQFAENPNAMFVLWKDHSALAEAEEINRLARSWGGEDVTKYEGGIYSSEWFWAKVLHVLRADPTVREAAHSWVEHCDWIPALLTGNTRPVQMRRSRCAAGHKAMWHPDWQGLPPEAFLSKLDPLLAGLRERLFTVTQTAEDCAGSLTAEWARRLGLHPGVKVAVGAFDAHMGAVGGQIAPNTLVKIMGTSTCDIVVTPSEQLGSRLVKGICGQVDGSVYKGMIGLEAGQSAFGDVYAWYKRLLMFPLEHADGIDPKVREAIADGLIPALEREALKVPVGASPELALDWMNGRRTPDADQALKGAIVNLNLGSDAPRVYRALIEATAYGSKAIVDRFAEQGVEIKGVIALGGVSKKSPLVMQTLCDVLGMPVKVVRSEQACALGAAMFAAVAAGVHPDAPSAQNAMGSGFDAEYRPIPANVEKYKATYARYRKLAGLIEGQLTERA